MPWKKRDNSVKYAILLLALIILGCLLFAYEVWRLQYPLDR